MILPGSRPLTAEQLADAAERLAGRHALPGALGRRPSRRLVERIESSRVDLERVYDFLVAAARRREVVLPAGEWILDNNYIIREQFLRIREHLTKGYYRKLPKLASGPLRGYPRVYEIVSVLATGTENVVDHVGLSAFLNAYQNVDLLGLGELWAVPIMVRIVMIERLEDLSREILQAHEIRVAVERVSAGMLGGTEESVSAALPLDDLRREDHFGSDLFLALTARTLDMARGLSESDRIWFDREFARRATSIEQVLDEDTRRESERQVAVSNSIISLRDASETDWTRVVEDLSVVEQTLRLDPAGIYPRMDFRTRDRYRGRIEHLAEHSDCSEFDVARRLLQLAERGAPCADLPAETHVGWMLLEQCRDILEQDIGYRPPTGVRVRRWVDEHPGKVFFTTGILIFLVTLAVPVLLVLSLEPDPWLVLLAAAAATLPAWDLSTALVNWLISMILPPCELHRMSFKEGIPEEHRAVVVVPTLLSSTQHAREQIEQLEIRAIANPDPNIRYALLTGLPDAPEAEMPEDAAIVQAAVSGVRALNERHDNGHGSRFFLLHRERRWNASEGVWMEWERKRGKLEEFNRILTDPEAETSFTVIEGGFEDFVASGPVSYVITLDADTRLPTGAARDLIRTAAHPFNVPVLESEVADTGRVVRRGYAILQPRISILPEEANRTTFARFFSGNVGLDPYTTAVSDAYQDLFGEGIYTGKGLYHVAVFRDVLDGAFPENAVLSHDLLEGSIVRTALVTNIELFDSYPSTYAAYANRLHRWIRGDWQLLPWILGTADQHVPGMGRWKMLDNLRRSLSMPAMMVFFLFGWTAMPGLAARWTLLGIVLLALPLLLGATSVLLTRPTRGPGRRKLSSFRHDMLMDLSRAGLTVTVLPDMARVSIDAIARTLWRLFVSRRKLLEWQTAWDVELGLKRGIPAEFGRMWPNVAVAGVVLISFVRSWSIMRSVALPFALVWLAGPVVTWALGRPRRTARPQLAPRDVELLRVTARRTWAFFDRTIGPPEPWLPPDNVQLKPSRGIARRTSPTNMGLALLAVLAAHDLGYVTRRRLLLMLEHMLDAMRGLDRYRGHFYNWYDTTNSSVLRPRYISTVDSGNLLASLVVLREGLAEIADAAAAGAGADSSPVDAGAGADSSPVDAGAGADRNPTIGLVDILGVLREEAGARVDGLGEPVVNDLLAEIDGIAAMADSGRPLCESEELLAATQRIRNIVAPYAAADDTGDLAYWGRQPEAHVREFCFGTDVRETGTHAAARARGLVRLCDELIRSMEFGFLFDRDRHLFSIGFNEDRMALDPATYDLFASEARVASFLAIARGDVSVRHWFRLSRRLTEVDGGGRALVSWGGTMFEYLMPLLFMKRYPHSLLDETYENALRAQIELGERRGLPWGVSESGYGVLNLDLDYQYRAFGVPELGLKRGLALDYVVAPYATLLSLPVDPPAALRNLRRLRKEGLYGSMGYYEAIDYTHERRRDDGAPAIVYSYMAHHQGMGLLSIVNLLCNNNLQSRFHTSPLVRSVELLLQERLPDVIELTTVHAVSAEREPGEESRVESAVEHVSRADLDGPVPRTLMLTNGRLHTCITATGTGYTALGDTLLTTFTPDRVADGDGLFVYVRDIDRDSYWSAGHQPVGREADRYDAWLHINKFESARVDDWIETFTEVCVSPLDDVELRRITLTNYSSETRRLEVTSFAGLALLERRSFEEHPAFYKLFVQTEYLDEHRTLLAHRRRRRADDNEIWMIHGLIEHDGGQESEPVRYETDRRAFLGRGGTPDRPLSVAPSRSTSAEERTGPDRTQGALGSVLDPAVSLSCVVELGPGESTQVTFTTGAARDRERAVRLADQYDNPYAVERAFNLAHAYGLIQLTNFGIRPDDSLILQRLAGALLYGHPDLRTDVSDLESNRAKQPALWPYGISGDRPLVVAHVPDAGYLDTVRLLTRAHAFWRFRGFHVDILFVNESGPSYMDDLGEDIRAEIESPGRHGGSGPGVLVVRRADEIPERDMILLHTVARVVVRGTLAIPDDPVSPASYPRFVRRLDREEKGSPESGQGGHSRADDGGKEPHGDFSEDGREFVITLPGGPDGPVLPPMPWINVIANERVGFLATERGAGATWSRNSRENRLTPWSNDPVSDPVEEAIYLRDEAREVYWSPTPGPAPDRGAYEIRHGFGRTTYFHEGDGLREEVTRFVDERLPVKVTRLALTNSSTTERRLTVFFYNRLVLGVMAERSGPYVVTKRLPGLDAVIARNSYNNEFADLIAGAALISPQAARSVRLSTDRAAFVGRNEWLSAPAAVCSDALLDDRTGGGLDPCAAFSCEVVLPAGETVEWMLVLGQTESEEEFAAIAEDYSRPGAAEAALARIEAHWSSLHSRLTVRTPSETLDELVNGWLMYQNVACRLTGRTAFYQSGGAIGFRDQLQDSAALLSIRPERTRHQILIHAARQFREGDVQHWWHPPTGRGVRTRISDDLLWLPWVTSEYLAHTGDDTILDEHAPFLDGPLLDEDEHERYFTPAVSSDTATVLEHCCRAIDRSLTAGVHGFPLIGTGDWNDGMDRVGDEGRGESVWLGFFLYDILRRFIPRCEKAGEDMRARQYNEAVKRLEKAFEGPGWDGEWYRRAFYDDGTPLGSADADECRIDAIAQAWAVLTGAAPPDRARLAMDSVDRHLVDPARGIIRLLAPPFDRTDRDPGYIKGYVPGVRENGGQYTHAAMWVVQAFTRLGRGTRAFDLLEMILPPNRVRTPGDQRRYQVEPYAIAADIYAVPPHGGRGGWTWYTGSAGWMYRVIVESILGLSMEEGDRLVIRPCVPARWEFFDVTWRPPGTDETFEIRVRNPTGIESGVSSCTLDGADISVDGERAVVPIRVDGSSAIDGTGVDAPAGTGVRRVEIVMGGVRAQSGGSSGFSASSP